MNRFKNLKTKIEVFQYFLIILVAGLIFVISLFVGKGCSDFNKQIKADGLKSIATEMWEGPKEN